MEAQEAAATAAVALAEAAKVAARMALALAVVERVAVGLRRWWKEGGGEAMEARAAAVWAAVERVGEAVARLVKEAEEREAAAMEAARSVRWGRRVGECGSKGGGGWKEQQGSSSSDLNPPRHGRFVSDPTQVQHIISILGG